MSKLSYLARSVTQENNLTKNNKPFNRPVSVPMTIEEENSDASDNETGPIFSTMTGLSCRVVCNNIILELINVVIESQSAVESD
jgi:hypothetical protein